MLLLGSFRALEDRDDALAAGGADRDHAASFSVFVQLFGEAGDDPPAGRRERVRGGERAAVDVQLRAVDRAERFVPSQLLLAEAGVFPGLQRAADLGGEGVVDLVVV